MIVLYTDFGPSDLYVGQMHAVFAREAPGVPVIDLLHHVPNFDIRAAAYLLPALAAQFPSNTIFVCIVDPGVGSERAPVVVHADGRWYVGPDNGLFHVLVRLAKRVEARTITWHPEHLSTSFHGRDLFAPVAAMLARGHWPASTVSELSAPIGEWPDDLSAVIYIDHYGNAMTGLRAERVKRSASLMLAGQRLSYAMTFSAVPLGTPFWYENSVGLVEVAVNRGNAAARLGLQLGMPVSVLSP